MSANDPQWSIRHDFLYPIGSYHGIVTPDRLAFNANLQEFAQKVGYVSGLHAAGKLSSGEAYQRIHSLWRELKHSKKTMLAEDFQP